MTTPQTQVQQELMRLPLERILAIGITGSGKSYQWLKIAKKLKPFGVKFRCVDTDNDIDFMLRTGFPELLPENGGNVYVFPAFDWTEYEKAVKWIQQRGLTLEQVASLDKHLQLAYKTPVKPYDWIVVDKSNNAWSSVQNHFVTEVFGQDTGEYFLEVRKKLHDAGDIGKSGKKAVSTVLEGLDGWKDWSVINKLYDDWINPIVYRVRCHVYATADVDALDKTEKDPEVLSLFGNLRIKPAGQKKIGSQMHSILLYIPGTDSWLVTTCKDRAEREYFKKTPFTDLYNQYLFAKAKWPLIMEE
jgi:hypothetical protein